MLVGPAVTATAVLFLTAPGASGRTGATTIHLYAPFNGGAPAAGIVVARSARGYCWTGSNTTIRSDAYRCFVGNLIHDPCFANQTVSVPFVLCPLYLPNSKVLRINLTRPLPANHAGGNPTRYPPWALQLPRRPVVRAARRRDRAHRRDADLLRLRRRRRADRQPATGQPDLDDLPRRQQSGAFLRARRDPLRVVVSSSARASAPTSSAATQSAHVLARVALYAAP